ncbi:MAG: 5-carboxymethyl-2-hydroxymuconate isomerase [Psychrobium sp.]
MPHFIVEHSANIRANDLLPIVDSAARQSGLFTGPDIQVRTMSYENSIPAKFVHVQARIWQGRTLAQKLALSQAVGSALKSELEDTVVTVEVVDIDKATYFKS